MPSRRKTDFPPGFKALLWLCCFGIIFVLTSCPPEFVAEKIVEVVK
jgi:hypothetical protein